MTSKRMTLVESLTMKCPYCTGNFTVGTTDNDEPVILHSVPTCEKYDAIQSTDDAVRYMRAAGAN